MPQEDKNEKRDEQFSSVILGLAFVAYLTGCAFIMGGLAKTNTTYVTAVLKFFQDFGAIVAGIPVFFAVILAKLQLDTNKQHHKENIINAVKKEIRAMQDASLYAERLQKYCDGKIVTGTLLAGNNGVIIPQLPDEQLAMLKQHLPFSVSSALSLTKNAADEIQSYADQSSFTHPDIPPLISNLAWCVRYLRNTIADEKDYHP